MSTDRELLELAAKAAGYRCHRHGEIIPFEVKTDPMGPWWPWNPRDDDGDALRLAVMLGICLDFANEWVAAYSGSRMAKQFSERQGTDPAAATRRAIVRAAAAIGEAML